MTTPTTSRMVLGRMILMADLETLPDPILQRVIHEAVRPLPEIRAANMGFLAKAGPALSVLTDLGFQDILSQSAEASAAFIRAHERILPVLPHLWQLEGEALQQLGQASRAAVILAQILRERTNRLAVLMREMLAEPAFQE